MEAHPLCRILPEMPEAEFRPLVADIRDKGLLRPITTFEGMILDGRHRFKACAEAGVTPRFEPYTGTDPVGFVQSCCIHRSLNPTQRAMVAAGFLEYEREQAKVRQVELGKSHGTLRTDQSEGVKGRARDKAGARMGVAGTTVSDAARVIEKAIPEVIEKCRSGDMALNEAKRIVDLNPAAQRRIAGMPKKQRDGEISSAHARSVACKKRDTKPTAPPAVPGTPFVRTFLSGMERIAMVCAEQSMKSGGDIAARFLEEMDWDAQALSIQFERCLPVFRAIAIVTQHTETKSQKRSVA